MANIFTTRRFVIFGQSRAGTTLLQELLNSHPEIQCDGELLNLNQKYLANRQGYQLHRRFPLLLIYRQLWAAHRPAYGCKLLVEHLAYVRATLTLLEKIGWKIIHVQRRDVLHQSFSLLVALKTDRWHRQAGEALDDPLRVQITESELKDEICKRQLMRARENKVMKSLSPLSLFYEDNLQQSDDQARTLGRVFDFIGVRPHPVNSSLQPTYERPYSEIVENYAGLCQAVEGLLTTAD